MTDLDAREARELELLLALESGPAYLADVLDPRYRLMAHTRLASDAIARIDRATPETRPWLMVNTPPQVGKTVTVIEWTAFWWLLRHPDHRIIIVSYNDDFAADRGRGIRRLVDRYGHLFGASVQRGTARAKDWRLTSGGGVYSSGLRGGITGHSATGVILIDDYLKSRAEADSARERSRLLNALSADVISRRAPGVPVIMTCTLWHHLEPSRVLLTRLGTVDEGGRWINLRLPALADSPDDPLGRALGEPLERVTPDGTVLSGDAAKAWWEEQRAGMNPRDFAALCQANPRLGETALMTSEQVRASVAAPPAAAEVVRSVLAVDPADADDLDATGHDATGISHVVRTRTGHVHVMADYTMHGSVDTWSQRVVELASTLDIDEIVYERNKGGRAVESVIRSAWSRAVRTGATDRPPPMITPVTATKHKITRASPAAQMLISGEATMSPGLMALQDQLETYQPGSADSPDAMDAMVWGVTHIYRPARRARTVTRAQWDL